MLGSCSFRVDWIVECRRSLHMFRYKLVPGAGSRLLARPTKMIVEVEFPWAVFTSEIRYEYNNLSSNEVLP